MEVAAAANAFLAFLFLLSSFLLFDSFFLLHFDFPILFLRLCFFFSFFSSCFPLNFV